MSNALCRPDCPFGTGVIPSVVECEHCPIHDKLCPTLAKHFGYSSLKPGQADAVLALLHGHDVFVRMATGSGKSLCMFLPPLICGESACAIIISPLIGLMASQVCLNVLLCVQYNDVIYLAE